MCGWVLAPWAALLARLGCQEHTWHHSASLVLWFSPPLPAPAPKFAPFWQELDGESEEMAPPVTAGMNEGLAGVADGAQAAWFGFFWLNVLAPGAGGLRGAAQGSVQSPLHFGLFPGVWQ